MRQIVFALSVVLMGCSQTSTAQRPNRIAIPDTPIVSKQPTISEKLRFTRQQEQIPLAKSEVTGNVVR